MDEKAESSDTSIEEDIQEEIGTSISSEKSSGSNVKIDVLKIKKQKLFGINDDEDLSDSKGNQFVIGDSQLSGGQIAKHFQSKEDSNGVSKFKNDDEKSKDTSKNEFSRADDDERSITNQNTTNDVSGIADEESQVTNQPMQTRSLELKNNDSISLEKRTCKSLDTVVEISHIRQKNEKEEKTDSDSSIEQDHSLEEILRTNESIEITLNDKDLSSLDPNIDINNEDQINQILNEGSKTADNSLTDGLSSGTGDEDIDGLKEKILSMKLCPKSNESGPVMCKDISFEQNEDQKIVSIKQMERIQTDFDKEVLEDITEESEKCSAPQSLSDHENPSNKFDSIVSLNMIEMLENKVRELEDIVTGKDICLESLNLQLDAAQRREMFASKGDQDSLKDIPPSGRESSSIATNSTEYRTIQEDFGNKIFDFHLEIAQKNSVIEKLTDSLQQSMKIREQLQQQSEQLSLEVQQLRRQLTETLDVIRKPYWPRDQESTGQRLSEISIDLVSESDDDLERPYLTDNDEKISTSNRNSKERQLLGEGGIELFDHEAQPITKQIEQFQKFLNPDELRIFFMVQKKFDDLLSQEIEKTKMKFDNEVKTINEQVEMEKHEKDSEINRLRNLLANIKSGSTELIELRQELEIIHSGEMEKLRLYFEKKCADLEKQYSEEVFSQKSARDSLNSGSDLSEQENLPEENSNRSKESSPRKRTRRELYTSPSHRQITPIGLSSGRGDADGNHINQDQDPGLTVHDLKTFYQEKIQDIKKNYEEIIRRQNEKIKQYEKRYADDDFMRKSHPVTNENLLPGQGTSSYEYVIIDEDEAINESQEIRTIAAEYERRLQEQITLAKEDILHELENHIQALLSETTTDDHHWPPELILLREKFTAKSQLEIAQLQIKHEEEMSRLKSDYEKQLNRKIKRNSTFDLSRDLDQIISDRENLRELSCTFRWLLCELAKYVTICEEDFNTTFMEELNNLGDSQNSKDIEEQNSIPLNTSGQSNRDQLMNGSKRLKAVNVSGLLSVIDDPQLVEFITNDNYEISSFNLKDCLEKLKSEANYLLELSEELNKRNQQNEEGIEKNDSCEEEDGLKSGANRTPKKVTRASSFNESVLRNRDPDSQHLSLARQKLIFSLPPNIQDIEISSQSVNKGDESLPIGPASELNVHVHELKNRLVKSENDRQKLQKELEETIARNAELGIELNSLREQLEQLDSQKEDYSVGYTIGLIKSPQGNCTEKVTSFLQLQEKARNFLSSPAKNMSENTQLLLQMIEDFCREGEKVVDDGKKEKEDLQLQVEAADKQLRAIRQFLDDQATERELERDDFLKEIEKLKNQIKEKDKERNSFEVASKEMEHMDQQIKELTKQVAESETKKDKIEIELKASIDKIFVLREIISELETQIETKALNEHVLGEKVKELESYISTQSCSHESFQRQVENLKAEIGQEYQEKISHLEEQLKNSRPTAEQSIIWIQITEQLRDIESCLEQKTKTLEALHHSVCSTSCSTSPIEDVSVQGHIRATNPQTTTNPTSPQGSPVNVSPRQHSLPVDEVQRVYEKLAKHTRVEEAAIKRIKDLEMQVVNIRTCFAELQHERDILQEKMSEQLQRISSLQTKLDEQRHRAEELQRQGTTDYPIRIHDLQNEVQTLKETLSVRDKQIANLKNQLEQSKLIIERQETELTVGIQSDRSVLEKLEVELKKKSDENRKLKEKMKSEMINKLALPDLMETMLADKNEEIDHLKEQLQSKEKELQEIHETNSSKRNSRADDKEKSKESDTEGKLSARTLSDIHSISEYDEPEAIRHAPLEKMSPLVVPDTPQIPDNTMEQVKLATITFAAEREMAIQSYDAPNYFHQPTPGTILRDTTEDTPSLIPRRINFSELNSTPQIEEINKSNEIKILNAKLKDAEDRIESLKISNELIGNEKNDEIELMKADIAKKTELLENLTVERDDLRLKLEELSKKLECYLKIESELKEKESELFNLQKEYNSTNEKFNKIESELKNKSQELENLKGNNEKLRTQNETLEKKCLAISDSEEKIKVLEEQVHTLNNLIQQKDEMLSKQQKNLLNWQQNEKNLLEKVSKLEFEIQTVKTLSNVDVLRDELNLTKAELSQKMLLYEKCLLDIQAYQKEIEMLRNSLKDKDLIITSLSNDSKSLQEVIIAIQQRMGNNESVSEVKQRLNEERQRSSDLEYRNSALEVELEKLRSQNSDSSKPYSVDEIAEQVEKELNYSVQLDSNILKAIESEEENNLNTRLKTDHEKLIERDLLNQIQDLKDELETERKQSTKIMEELKNEKAHLQEIQQQDAEIIQALRIRLEESLKKEDEFHNILDEERARCERLSNQISILQRSEARKASMQLKSPPDSPRKPPRDFELELAERLKTEMKLLTAQNERERERVADLQRGLEREKVRFETELSDRINYAEKLKKEMEKLIHEKDMALNQAEHLEERLSLASREIESLEARISVLQETETRRAHRRGKERIENTQNAVELQELKSKVISLEAERDHLNKTISLLRDDIERGAQREARLAETLTNTGSESSSIPETFMLKLKEMNNLLAGNTKENRQMSETLHYLTEERKGLQKRIEELESENQSGAVMASNLMELEERANHLFGKYLRVESHRKALVHQKRYLLIVLQTYRESETKALELLNVNVAKKSKRTLFKSVALVVIAVQRMKFIVRRWQTGKRIVSKSVFHIQAQKRSTLPAVGNNTTYASIPKFSTMGRMNFIENPLSAPGLITDLSEQKVDWTRWKK